MKRDINTTMSNLNTPNKNTPTKKQKNRKENVKQKSSNPSTGKMKKPMMAQPVKVVEKVIVESPRAALPPKQDESWLNSMWNKAKDVGAKAWDWFKTGGWEQVLTIGASFLDDERTAHLAYTLDSGSVVPAGTVLFAEYITPSSFPATSLNDQARNFTFYEFLNSKIHVLGTGSDTNASGAIGIFVCSDAELEIQNATPTQIENLVRENGGRIVRLDKGTSVNVPPPMANALLYVTGNDQFDLRRSTQGQLFVIAYTDIDFSVNNVVVSFDWKAAFAKGTSSVMQPVPVLNNALMFQSGPFTQSYSSSLQVQYSFPKFYLDIQAGLNPYQTAISTPQYTVLFPGTYMLTATMQYVLSGYSGTSPNTVTIGMMWYDNNGSSSIILGGNSSLTNTNASGGNYATFTCSTIYSSIENVSLNCIVSTNLLSANSNTSAQFSCPLIELTIVPIVFYDGTISNPLNTLTSEGSLSHSSKVQSYLYARHHSVSKRALRHASKKISVNRICDANSSVEKDKDKDNKEKSLSSLSDAQLAALVRERRLSTPSVDGSARS